MKKPKLVKTMFATYTISGVRGEGGCGIVYEAQDEVGNSVAIKILDPSKANSEKLRRFKNEYRFCSRNKHPNIVTVADYGLTEDQNPFYVMPLYKHSLRSLIGKLSPRDAMDLFKKILDGVDAAHKGGVVHRDLKPENILTNGIGSELVITDFGIAEFEESDLYTAVETKDSSRLANFVYAAPEQKVRGKSVDKKADIYALGLILNELFTNEVAQGTDYKTIGAVDPNFRYLDIVVGKSLQQNPTNRFGDIDELKREILSRSNEQISLQKLSTLKETVIPTTEVDDPIISDPMRIVGVDWERGTLSIELNHSANQNWRWALQNMGGYSSVMGKGPEMFQFDGKFARIGANKDDAQRIIDYFKVWLPMAQRAYEGKIQRDLEKAERDARAELQRKIKEEEETAKLKSSLRF